MFVACGIWCLADFSSVSPSSEQTGAWRLFYAADQASINKSRTESSLFLTFQARNIYPNSNLKMSLRTLPILFLNLGGEMLYILDQRLRAQSIPDEKARKGEMCVSDK